LQKQLDFVPNQSGSALVGSTQRSTAIIARTAGLVSVAGAQSDLRPENGENDREVFTQIDEEASDGETDNQEGSTDPYAEGEGRRGCGYDERQAWLAAAYDTGGDDGSAEGGA